MKQRIAAAIVLVLALGLLGCSGEQEAEPEQKQTENPEIAMITPDSEMESGSFEETVWNEISAFAEERELESRIFPSESQTKKAYLTAIDEAVQQGVKMIVLPGESFESAAYEAQSAYQEVSFLLVDGIPHSEKNQYAVAENTVGIVFAEEEAGYLAGYAAVKDGYTKLGFIGGEAIPSIKRYGYGYMQGAAAAAAEMKTKVEMKYRYAQSSEESEEVQDVSAGWYGNGTEVIFVCGGTLNRSVIKAAEEQRGKVIGSDVDQSHLSDLVITSAEKGISVAVEKVLTEYANDRFVGGTAFNYAAKNDGVMLEIQNARFSVFGQEEYEKLYQQLKNGKIKLKKDTEVKSVSELKGDWITIKE